MGLTTKEIGKQNYCIRHVTLPTIQVYELYPTISMKLYFEAGASFVSSEGTHEI